MFMLKSNHKNIICSTMFNSIRCRPLEIIRWSYFLFLLFIERSITMYLSLYFFIMGAVMQNQCNSINSYLSVFLTMHIVILGFTGTLLFDLCKSIWMNKRNCWLSLKKKISKEKTSEKKSRETKFGKSKM